MLGVEAKSLLFSAHSTCTMNEDFDWKLNQLSLTLVQGLYVLQLFSFPITIALLAILHNKLNWLLPNLSVECRKVSSGP